MSLQRECELMGEITSIIDQVTATLKAFAQTEDLDELHDMLAVHTDRIRPLIDELKELVRKRTKR
jgi:hypothetical protein